MPVVLTAGATDVAEADPAPFNVPEPDVTVNNEAAPVATGAAATVIETDWRDSFASTVPLVAVATSFQTVNT